MKRHRSLSAAPNVSNEDWRLTGMVLVGALAGGAAGTFFGGLHCWTNTTDSFCGQPPNVAGFYPVIGTALGIGVMLLWSR